MGIFLFNFVHRRGMDAMADDDLLLRPERWHERALEARAMARNAKEAQNRKRLLKVARAYERLAVRAKDWKAARERQQSRGQSSADKTHERTAD
jgi:hypothetical protein